jgi:putative metallohydrolase (TIGR04338 family)
MTQGYHKAGYTRDGTYHHGRYPKTGIQIAEHADGSVTFDYGHSMGSTTFPSVEAMHETIPDWIAARRKRLLAEAVELEKVERAVEKDARRRAGGPFRMTAAIAPTTPRKPRRPYRMDPQAGRVYAAEAAAFLPMFGQSASGNAAVELPEYHQLRDYVTKVENDKWFRRHFGRRHFIVQDGRGLSRTAGNGSGRRINIAKDSRARWIVLHELAHCLTPPGAQAHGPEYVAIYLKLVRHFLGRKAWKALYAECRTRKVKMQRRRKARRPLTETEKAALRHRLAIARDKARAEKDALDVVDSLEADAERLLDEEVA